MNDKYILERIELGKISLLRPNELYYILDDDYLREKLVNKLDSGEVMDEEYKVIENWSRLAEKGDATELYLAFGEALYPKEVFEQSRQLMTEAAKTVTAEDLKRFVILAEGIKGFDASEHLKY